jgi:hypothetical protein
MDSADRRLRPVADLASLKPVVAVRWYRRSNYEFRVSRYFSTPEPIKLHPLGGPSRHDQATLDIAQRDMQRVLEAVVATTLAALDTMYDARKSALQASSGRTRYYV